MRVEREFVTVENSHHITEIKASKSNEEKPNLVVLLVNVKPQRLCSFLNFGDDFIRRTMGSKTGFSLHMTLLFQFKPTKKKDTLSYKRNFVFYKMETGDPD